MPLYRVSIDLSSVCRRFFTSFRVFPPDSMFYGVSGLKYLFQIIAKPSAQPPRYAPPSRFSRQNSDRYGRASVAIPCELGRLFGRECFLFAFHADTIAASIVRVNYMIRRKRAGRSVLHLAINQRAQQCVGRLVLSM
jgi:hypothetical protein